jgi:hypothetical protein
VFDPVGGTAEARVKAIIAANAAVTPRPATSKLADDRVRTAAVVRASADRAY